MSHITLLPAYGRDYNSLAAVKADLAAGKDFVGACYGHPVDGRVCNKADLLASKITSVNVRYGRLRKVAVVDLKGL